VEDIDLTHKQVNEARAVRDVEKAKPGVLFQMRIVVDLRARRFARYWRTCASWNLYRWYKSKPAKTASNPKGAGRPKGSAGF
jgi:sulfur relay (sulfurtransferase) DsrC/TusE family protein